MYVKTNSSLINKQAEGWPRICVANADLNNLPVTNVIRWSARRFSSRCWIKRTHYSSNIKVKILHDVGWTRSQHWSKVYYNIQFYYCESDVNSFCISTIEKYHSSEGRIIYQGLQNIEECRGRGLNEVGGNAPSAPRLLCPHSGMRLWWIYKPTVPWAPNQQPAVTHLINHQSVLLEDHRCIPTWPGPELQLTLRLVQDFAVSPYMTRVQSNWLSPEATSFAL